MRARPLLLACAPAVVVLLGVGPVAAAEPLRLETAGKVDALRTEDVDGDGVEDVVVLTGRTVAVWRGSREGLPRAAPTWRVEVPAHVSFVDVSREDRPSLLCLGADGAFRLGLGAGATAVPIEGSAGLGWRDGQKAVFAALHPGPGDDPTHVLLTPEGWGVRGGEGLLHRLTTKREVAPPGPFLEDTASATEVLPTLYSRKPPPLGGRAVPDHLFWSLAGDRLTLLGGPGEVTYDLSFLPGGARIRLVDVDGDGHPEVASGEGTNREVQYAFFRVPEPERVTTADGLVTFKPAGRDLRPPVAYLKLAGFPLEPVLTDLDGDGLQDLVQTTIALDQQNSVRAIMTGKVTATTLAFLQRKGAPGGALFGNAPDAVVTSDIWVRVRFLHTGTLDVARSFTILADGDLDGDGRKDLVIRSAAGSLALRRGVAGGKVWAAEPTAAPIPALGSGEELEAHAADLDGRPGDEVLLHYRGANTEPDRLVLLPARP